MPLNKQEVIKKALDKGDNYARHYYTRDVYDAELRAYFFSHEFAKAFWGEEWKHHLQKMILEKSYWNYLNKFV